MVRRVVLCAAAIIITCFLIGSASARKDDGENESMDKILNDPDHPKYIEANWNYTDHKFTELVEQTMKKLMPMVIRSSSGVELSGPCMSALFKMMLAIRQGKIWAYNLIDAWGKPPGGMIAGTLGAVGDYDECVNTVIPDLKDSEGNPQKGFYCLVTFAPILPPKPQLYTLFHSIKDLENITKKNTSFAESARNAHWFYLLKLRLGVCLPSACTEQDAENMLSEVPKAMNVKGNLKIAHCETKPDLVLEKEQIAILSILGVAAFFIFIGTLLDVITTLRQGDDPEPLPITKRLPHRFLICFSAYTNFRKLLNTRSGENSHLSAVTGVRAITITWVIVGHSYLYADYNMMRQEKRLSDLPPNFAFQVVANSMLTVDTFILISGLLVTYSVLKSQEKRRGLNIPMYIFHRFWRLTPPYMIVIALLIMTPILGSGPVWKITLDPLIQNCKDNWWTNLLYVNNFVNAYDFCLEHTWYLGVDMQLHILGLVVLLPLIRWPKVAAFLGVLLAVGFSAVASIVNIIHDLPPSPLGLFPDPDDRIYVEVPNYFKPYGHVGPYILGMLLGYIVVKKPKLKISQGLRLFGWLFFTALTLTDLYGAYPWNNGNVPGPIVSALYAGTSRTVWAIGIFWLLFVCITGNGGVINSILSWKAWIPLSRLSYVFYLIHPVVIWVHEAFAHDRMYTSHYFWVYNIFGHFMMSLAVSLVISLSFEAPFLALEKVLFFGGGREGRKSSSRDPHTKSMESTAYDSEMRPHTYSKAMDGKNGMYRNGGPETGNGMYRVGNGDTNRHNVTSGNGIHRNGGSDGYYRTGRENGNGHMRTDAENGAFCRL